MTYWILFDIRELNLSNQVILLNDICHDQVCNSLLLRMYCMNSLLLTKKEIDLIKLREDFPILKEQMNNRPLIYLDNSNTTQKPLSVISAMNHFYCHDNANLYRSFYPLGERATALYENARNKVQKYINAKHRHEIVFVKGTTEAINLVAHCFGILNIKSGDEIIVSLMEHHSNIVPWQHLCEQTGAILKVIPLNEQGEVLLDEYSRLLSSRTKLVAITQASHVLGTNNPIKNIIAMADSYNAATLVDGAQAIPHMVSMCRTWIVTFMYSLAIKCMDQLAQEFYTPKKNG